MAEFSVGGVQYKSRLLDGRKQIYILKRMLPTFTAVCGVAEQLATLAVPPAPSTDVALPAPGVDAAPAPRQRPMADIAALLMPVMEKLREAPDADVDFVCDLCMEVTERRARGAGGWVDVVVDGMVMNEDDSSFMNRMTIMWYVVGENFESMLASLGVDLREVMEKAGGLRRA